MPPDSTAVVSEKPLFCDRYLLVDGAARVGKMFASKLITNLTSVEFVQVEPMIENIGIIWRMGLMSDDVAISMLQIKLDNLFYDRAVGRHMNVRPDDILSIYRSLNHEELLSRSHQPDGNEAMFKLNRKGRIFSLVGHDMVPNQKLFFKAFPNLQFIQIVRHPVATVNSWFNRGWGRRLGVDPRAFTPTFESEKGPVPWWAIEWQEDYFEMSEIDRCIRGLLSVQDAYRRGVESMEGKSRDQLLTIRYENLVEKPDEVLERAAMFLKTSLHPQLATAMEYEQVPRPLPSGNFVERANEIRAKASAEIFNLLVEAAQRYESELSAEARSFDRDG